MPVLIVIGVAGLLSYFYFGGKAKAPEEFGLTPIFEEQAGGRFDCFNLTVPFVRHSIYDDFIVISYGKKKYILKYAEINEVSNRKYSFSKGLTYHHNKIGIPSQCIVWSTDGGKAIEILRSKGIIITN